MAHTEATSRTCTHHDDAASRGHALNRRRPFPTCRMRTWQPSSANLRVLFGMINEYCGGEEGWGGVAGGNLVVVRQPRHRGEEDVTEVGFGGETRQWVMARRTEASLGGYRPEDDKDEEDPKWGWGGCWREWRTTNSRTWLDSSAGPRRPHRTLLLLLILFHLLLPPLLLWVDEPTLRGADAAGAPAMALLPRTWIIEPSAERPL
ncbi:hypothetical protein BHM03_00047349 [Ensete ventricosum]|nr:hypothetical protein BHM03_00047349 [Ensete ventricosum]